MALFPDHGAALTHLLAISPVATVRLIRDVGALEWLAKSAGVKVDGKLRACDLQAAETGTPFDPTFRALRRLKGREMLRIALREVGGWASVEETTRELTELAEFCLQVVCEGWLGELEKRWGKAGTEFAVLGMGKLGGQELNYSSDIDVVFFYGEDGAMEGRGGRYSHQEFFTRLAEKIVGTFAAPDPAGALFRIDLRLRPDGASGPLVRSMEALERYYSGFGETWERMALIKARVVAGTPGREELGYEFTHRLQPFIYPRTVSHDVLEEIAGLKGRIEREIVGGENLDRNVKLGRGGIREIEFVAQSMQLLHGARHAFLQERNTLKALAALRELGILPREEMEQLIGAYRFLRTVEHRLQIAEEAQTHTLPESEEELGKLARSLAISGALGERGTGNADGGTGEALAVFRERLAGCRGSVRAVFERVLVRGRREEEARDLSFFPEEARARRELESLEQGGKGAMISGRTRRLYGRLERVLLQELRAVADPQAALIRFVHFVERYGSRGLLFETLLRSPRVLELLVRLFDASAFMTEIVLRRPQLIEEIARGGGLSEGRSAEEHLAGLARNEEGLPWQDAARGYRRAEVLRIGLRDILRLASVREVQAEFSSLAEACVIFAQEKLGLAEKLTVIAMGKFGGRELAYGADLDVVFLGDPAGAASLMRTLSAQTAEGSIFRVDARLRPEGESGPLALTRAAYEGYFARRAQVWEAQALTKARVISGPQKAEAQAAIQGIWRRFGEREELGAELRAMQARIVRERGGGELDFKTGPGGIMQVEFFTQYHQMRSGIWEPNTFEALGKLAEVVGPVTSELREGYEFLRRVEAVLRRMDDAPVSRLPAEEGTLEQMARRCGFGRKVEFLGEMERVRKRVGELAAW